MKVNARPMTEQEIRWDMLKRLIPDYIKEDICEGASDIMSLVKEAQNNIAIELPAIDETEELYKDLSLSVDVIEACMAGMELKYDCNSHHTSKQMRIDAFGRFKFYANKLEAE